MSFWQENYGFVKEVYDYRMDKYKEWMDNLEAIVTKVLAQNVQYTYKEFKIMKDILASLCRDLEKEGMKEWLDIMLEKVAVRVFEDVGSLREKDFFNTEKKRLQALIERHDNLMPKTVETQDKVEVFARCYAYGDDIGSIMKVLKEMHHLSTKNIHTHNLKMIEEQIERAEKVSNTLESVADQYDEYLKRGQKLVNLPHCAPFLFPLMETLQHIWKESRIKSKEKIEMLNIYAKCYSIRDDAGPFLKATEELRQLSIRESHPHTMKMVKEDLEKMEKVKSKVDGLTDQYDDLLKRGKTILKMPNYLPFIPVLVEKIETVYKDATEKSTERLNLLNSALKAWETYDQLRTHIIDPCNRLENDLKAYEKIFDPKVSTNEMKKRKAALEEHKTRANDMFKKIQKSYTMIVRFAGENKRSILEREINEIDQRRNIIDKCEAKLKELEDYNDKLARALRTADELRAWAKTTGQRLKELRNAANTTKTREERVKESINLQEDCRKKLVALSELDDEIRQLIPADDLHKSDVARKRLVEFEDMKKLLRDTYAEIEVEADDTSQFFGRVQELCKEWNNMKSTTDILIRSIHSLNPIYNPGVEAVESLLKRISAIQEQGQKIMRAM